MEYYFTLISMVLSKTHLGTIYCDIDNLYNSSHMIGTLAHLHLSYIANICSIFKSNNILIYRMTSFKLLVNYINQN